MLSTVMQAVCAADIQGPRHRGRREAFQPGGCCEESGSVTVWGARGGAVQDTRLPYGDRGVGRGKGHQSARSARSSGDAETQCRETSEVGLQGQHWSAVGERQMTCASS